MLAQVVRHFEHHLAQWRQAQPAAQPVHAARAKPAAAAHRHLQQQAAQPSQQPQDGVPQLPPPPPFEGQASAWPRSEALPHHTSSSQSAQQGGDSGSHNSACGSCCSRSSSTDDVVGGAAHSTHAQSPPSGSLHSSARGSCSQHSPQHSGRSLGSRRVADCSGAGACGAAAPHAITIRVSSSLLDDMESGWSSSRSLQVRSTTLPLACAAHT